MFILPSTLPVIPLSFVTCSNCIIIYIFTLSCVSVGWGVGGGGGGYAPVLGCTTESTCLPQVYDLPPHQVRCVNRVIPEQTTRRPPPSGTNLSSPALAWQLQRVRAHLWHKLSERTCPGVHTLSGAPHPPPSLSLSLSLPPPPPSPAL